MMDEETKDVLEKLLRQLTSGPDPALTRTPMQKAKALRLDDSQLRLSKARKNYKESCYAMERVEACYKELLAATKEAKALLDDLDLNDPGRITFIMKGMIHESAGG